jgi:ribonuclease E
MSKKMMVNATHPEENRVAIVEDGVLTELDIEVAGREPTKGNIYKAVVVRVETGLQAAFVDYGAERLGFLQIDEINYTTVKPDYKPAEDGRRPRINDLLNRGQELLVQITKEERGTKGAALTTYISLAGRYMVLMPSSQTRGVSRKAESDAQRKELKKAMASIDLAEGVGYIVRTAALDQTREELERDYRYLIRLYESIKELEQKARAPALIYKESNLMIRSIRDYFTTDMDEVLIDDPQVFKEAKDFFQMVMPDQVKLVKLHQERRPIFSRYQIEDQIETLSRNQVSLPSGGSIVIDPTEALVAIDVNSGKMASEKGVEATATKTNLEAAAEVGRQLRLRDLGGLIVIDFIDMRERKNMRQVENELKKSLENDKARVNVGRISKFGLMEMSRQRIKSALTEGSYLTCPHCHGSGHLKSPETQAVALLRKIHASAAKGQVSKVEAQLHLDVAGYLLNHKREELIDMERRYQLQIHIHGNRDFLADQVEIEIEKKEKEKSTQPEFVAAGTLPMVIEEPTKKESSEPAQQDAAEGEPEPSKKRRRRRRRKPAAATADEAQTTEQSATDTQDDQGTQDDKGTQEAQDSALKTESTDTADTPAVASSPDEVAAPAETTTAQTDTKPPAKRPQRRRRSPSKARATEKPTEAAVEATPTESPATGDKPVETTTDVQAVVETSTVETKPKRRRPPRRRPKAAESATQPETTADTAGQTQRDKTTEAKTTTGADTESKPAEQPATEQAIEEKETTETKPRQRRPRRPARKPATKTEAPEVKQDKPAAQTTREAVESSEVKSDAAQVSQPAAATEEKPKRRRTTRAKPKAKTAEATETPAVKEAPQAAKEVPPTGEKPVKKAPVRRASRKAPAKKTVTSKEGVEATAAKDKASEKPTEEKPKPKRRRTVRKKPTEVETSSND